MSQKGGSSDGGVKGTLAVCSLGAVAEAATVLHSHVGTAVG